jgi:hypothetical protein
MIQLFDKYACDATMRQLELCENICFLLVIIQLKLTLLYFLITQKLLIVYVSGWIFLN